MNQIDVFNGDADGICALIQLRQAFPADSTLITGVKRDIGLLSRVSATAGDQVNVLDISLESNRPALLGLLQKSVRIFYVDHHFPGDIPAHAGLTSLINTDANLCTSLLVSSHINHRYPAWAVTGAFGDNLGQAARLAAQPLAYTETELEQLQKLGIAINYNAYGESLDDLHVAPDALFRLLAPYSSPLDFIAEQPVVFQQLADAYLEDMQQVQAIKPDYQTACIAVFILPNEKWARRISGVWGNELANLHPARAHAVLSSNQRGGYQVSVRAPLNNKTGADSLCNRFPEGGGRKAAAGINHLEISRLAEFIQAFSAQYAS